MGLFKSIFKPRDTPQPKNHTGDSVGGGRYFSFDRTWSGKSVTEQTAMQKLLCILILYERFC